MPPDNTYLFSLQSHLLNFHWWFCTRLLKATHTWALSASLKTAFSVGLCYIHFSIHIQYLTFDISILECKMDVGRWTLVSRKVQKLRRKKRRRKTFKRKCQDKCFCASILWHLGCKSVGYSVNRSFLDFVVHSSRQQSRNKLGSLI